MPSRWTPLAALLAFAATGHTQDAARASARPPGLVVSHACVTDAGHFHGPFMASSVEVNLATGVATLTVVLRPFGQPEPEPVPPNADGTIPPQPPRRDTSQQTLTLPPELLGRIRRQVADLLADPNQPTQPGIPDGAACSLTVWRAGHRDHPLVNVQRQSGGPSLVGRLIDALESPPLGTTSVPRPSAAP